MFRIETRRLYDELEELDIKVYDYDLRTCNALTVLVDGKYYIGINKNENFSEIMRFWLIQHELEHIKHGTFYHINDDKFIINKNERITNDAVITKLGIITPILESLHKGANKWEICSNYDIPSEIYDYCIDYIKRKGLTSLSSYIDLIYNKANAYTRKETER